MAAKEYVPVTPGQAPPAGAPILVDQVAWTDENGNPLTVYVARTKIGMGGPQSYADLKGGQTAAKNALPVVLPYDQDVPQDFADGTLVVTSTPAALNGGLSLPCSSVALFNFPDSADYAYLGKQGSQSMGIAPGEKYVLPCPDASLIYLSSPGGAKVGYHAYAGIGITSSAVPPLLLDTFSRADTTVTLGATEIGGFLWHFDSFLSGGTRQWGIQAARAYPVNVATDTMCWADPGISNYRARLTVNTTQLASVVKSVGIVFRMVDDGNYYVFRGGVGTTNNVEIIQAKAGVRVGSVLSGNATILSGVDALFEVYCNGTSVICSVNGSAVLSTTLADFLTATKVGMYAQATSDRLDSPTVYAA